MAGRRLFGAIGDSAPDRWGRLLIQRAMSMLDAEDNEPRSYMEIADALRRYGAKPEEDRV